MDASDDQEGPAETLQVRIRGRVQGVGFRDACVRQARAAGLTGWVRNRRDGSVEALLQGPADEVAGFCDWLRIGVPAARVDAVETTRPQAPCSTHDGFERLPTR